jgi:hypothetical protein
VDKNDHQRFAIGKMRHAHSVRKPLRESSVSFAKDLSVMMVQSRCIVIMEVFEDERSLATYGGFSVSSTAFEK